MIVAEAQIRIASVGDAAALNAIYNDYVGGTAVTFDIEPWTVEDRRRWLRRQIAEDEMVLALDTSVGPVGYAWTCRFRPKAAYRKTTELSIYLRKDDLGRGMGTYLFAELLRRAAAAGRHRALTAVALPNPASTALVRRHGFRSVGIMHAVGFKFGRYWDVEWYERALSEGTGVYPSSRPHC